MNAAFAVVLAFLLGVGVIGALALFVGAQIGARVARLLQDVWGRL